MKAIGVLRALPADNPHAFVWHDMPAPSPGMHDLLVRVDAVGVNPADTRVRMRKADDGTVAVLGWDVAGTVVQAGTGVRTFSPGDTVFYAGDLNRSGGNAELHLVDAALVGHRPARLTAAEAAALPLTALTAWEVLFERLGLPEPGTDSRCLPQTLLIVGGAGGAGSMILQLAGMVTGLTIVATASRAQSREWCLSLGADAVIDHCDDIAAQFAENGLPAPDLIVLATDPDPYFPALAALIAPQGRLCCLAPFSMPPDVNLLMRKSASLVWEFMFTRAMFSTPDRACQGEILNRVATMIDERVLVPPPPAVVGPISPETLRQAHLQLESKHTIGKLVLAGFPQPEAGSYHD